MDQEQDYRVAIAGDAHEDIEEHHDETMPRTPLARQPQSPTTSQEDKDKDQTTSSGTAPWHPMPSTWRSESSSTSRHMQQTPTTEMLPADLGWMNAYPYPSSSKATGREHGTFQQPQPQSRATRSPLSPPLTADLDLQGEQAMLLHLRDRERLSWTEIARRLSTSRHQHMSASQVQEHYGQVRRRAQGARHWAQADTNALRLAIESCGTGNFGEVSTKMSRLGATQSWTSGECKAAWEQLNEIS